MGQNGETLPLLSIDIPAVSNGTAATATAATSETTETTASAKCNKKSNTGTATVYETSLNICKTCMGTGTLALPYAASQGGILFSMFGMAIIATWNMYAVDRLIRCDDILEENGSKRHKRSKSSKQRYYLQIAKEMKEINNAAAVEADGPPNGTTKMGKVAWHCFGYFGLHILDFIMIIFFLGIIIAYEDAVVSFLHKTPVTTGSSLLDASIVSLFVIAPLSCVPDVGFLSKFSAVGILAIFFTFSLIFFQVLADNGIAGFREITWSDLWPESIQSLGNWFGCLVFGYGVAPITYNIQESMAQPAMMTKSTMYALSLVFFTYVIISNGVLILSFPQGNGHDYQGDVLKHLPIGWIPTAVRLSMTCVVAMTAPLLVIPCGELIEKKISGGNNRPFIWTVITRTSICMICTLISFLVPEFVSVIAFVGSFSVSLVSFVFPPLFYIVLMRNKDVEEDQVFITSLFKIGFDVIMFILGVFATTLATFLSFQEMVSISANT